MECGKSSAIFKLYLHVYIPNVGEENSVNIISGESETK